MKEPIFNLFVYIQSDQVAELGIVKHLLEGTDDQKLTFLKGNVPLDCRAALRLDVPSRYLLSYAEPEPPSLRYETFKSMMLVGQHFDLFEDAFQLLDAPQSPLVCVTPVVNGEPKIEEVLHKNFGEGDRKTRIQGHYIVPSYLKTYKAENGFDLPRLLNDDFFSAIRLTYNNRLYVSSLKLLVSFIDTVAYLEFGDVPGNFQKFLDRYADLGKLGITASELWELRNSLLHMTNAESRKVASGRVSRLSFYVGELPSDFPTEFDDTKHFGLMDLIKMVAKTLEKWLETFNNDRSKFSTFVDRYDKIYSDVRLNRFMIFWTCP
jgi:hypothetical protein